MYRPVSGRRAASLLLSSRHGLKGRRCPAAGCPAQSYLLQKQRFTDVHSKNAKKGCGFLGRGTHRLGSVNRGFAAVSSSNAKTQPAAESPSKEDEKAEEQGLWPVDLPPPLKGLQHPGEALSRTVTTWQQRTAAYARTSFLSAYAAFIDNTLVALLQFVRADEGFRRITPWLEDRLAWLSRTWHIMADGRRVSYSLVNNTSPRFDVPPQYSAATVLPDLAAAEQVADYDALVCHFMSLCMKLVYEKEEVIQDIVEARWGMRFYGYYSTGSEEFVMKDGSAFVPRTRAVLFGSERALVLAFRGSEPTNLINLRSAGRISMTERAGLGGRVHDGFYGALFHGDEEAGALFTQLVEAVRAADDTGRKALYVTGHSLGAALATVFAEVLRARRPELADKIAGVYAFAAPRVGDAGFARSVNDAYSGRAYRIAYGADIIPHLPPMFLEYRDAGEEVFITSFGSILRDPKEVKRWHQIEGWGFLPLYLYKLVGGALNPREGAMRTLYRVGLLVTFPGLNDHLPAEYEGRLRRALPDTSAEKRA